MPNTLFIKTDENKLLVHFRPDQDYSDLVNRVAALMAEWHPGRTCTNYALCDSSVLDAQVEAGKDLQVGKDVSVHGDFDVVQKQAVSGAVIIPPMGLTGGDLADTDDCVCYAV
jgi:hypothetical protein